MFIPFCHDELVIATPVTDHYLALKDRETPTIFHDFLKIWLYVDGPKKILDYVKEWENNIEIPKFMHTCQACAFIYQNKRVQEIINNNFKKCYTEVLERFKAKQTLKNAKII